MHILYIYLTISHPRPISPAVADGTCTCPKQPPIQSPIYKSHDLSACPSFRSSLYPTLPSANRISLSLFPPSLVIHLLPQRNRRIHYRPIYNIRLCDLSYIYNAYVYISIYIRAYISIHTIQIYMKCFSERLYN